MKLVKRDGKTDRQNRQDFQSPSRSDVDESLDGEESERGRGDETAEGAEIY